MLINPGWLWWWDRLKRYLKLSSMFFERAIVKRILDSKLVRGMLIFWLFADEKLQARKCKKQANILVILYGLTVYLLDFPIQPWLGMSSSSAICLANVIWKLKLEKEKGSSYVLHKLWPGIFKIYTTKTMMDASKLPAFLTIVRRVLIDHIFYTSFIFKPSNCWLFVYFPCKSNYYVKRFK